MKRVLMLSTVASLQDQFNMANIRMLRNLHCDVHVACNFVQGNNTSPQRIAVFQNELAALGVTCHQIDFARSPFHLLQNHRAYQQLKAVLRADAFDCIHCHTPVGGIYGRKLQEKDVFLLTADRNGICTCIPKQFHEKGGAVS